MPILSILNSIQETSKRTEKEAILKANSSDETLKRVFVYAYHPRVSFNIKAVPDVSILDETDEKISLGDALDIIDHRLLEQKTRGGAASEVLRSVLASVTEDDREVIKRVIKRDLRVGCSASTINKIWPKTIAQQPCMGAQAQSTESLSNIMYPAYAQLKADGQRCHGCVTSKDQIEMISRNSKIYEGLTDIKKDLAKFEGFALDGELVYMEDGVEIREKSNGIVGKALKGTISDEEQKHVVFQVWDIIPLGLYYDSDQSLQLPYSQRLEILKDVVSKCSKSIQVIPSVEVHSLSEAQEVANKYMADGLEGIILKNKTGLWVNKRSIDQVKFKAELYADLRIIDIIEGEGKFEGMMGRMLVESDDGLVRTHVGIGDKNTKSLTNEARQEMFDNKDDYIGRVAEIKYNGLTKVDGSNTYSLFLPRFTRIRDDKDDTNALGQMQ